MNRLPERAASVSTFVVSWKDAAEIKLWVLVGDALVIPKASVLQWRDGRLEQ